MNCPKCGGERIVMTTVGQLIPSKYDWRNRGTCTDCDWQAKVGVFQMTAELARLRVLASELVSACGGFDAYTDFRGDFQPFTKWEAMIARLQPGDLDG